MLLKKRFSQSVHTGRGNSGCDSQNVCYHAPSHEMAANAPATDSDEIPPLHTEKKEKEIQAYIVHPILQKRHIYGEYHKLVKEHPPRQPGPHSTKTKELIGRTNQLLLVLQPITAILSLAVHNMTV